MTGLNELKKKTKTKMQTQKQYSGRNITVPVKIV